MTDKKIKVLVVRDRDSAGGGIVSFLKALDDYQQVDRRNVYIGRPMDDVEEPSFFVRITLCRLIIDYVRLVVRIMRFRPNLVHFNTSLDREKKAIRRDGLNVGIARLLRRKVLVFWHGWYYKNQPEFPGGGGNAGFLCRCYKRADAYVVLADSFRRDLIRWGFDRPVYVGSTTYDAAMLRAPGDYERSPADPAPGILFLAAASREKGIFELVEAYRILRRSGTGCRLTIAGNGPAVKEVERLLAEHDLPDVCLAGHVEGAQKIDLYRSHAVFCFPSHHEGMPVSVLEAMANGLPVVASTVGRLETLLEEGKTGTLIPDTGYDRDGMKYDPAVIAEQLKTLLVNPDLRHEISRHNLECASADFHPKKVAEELETIYKRLTG